MKNSNCKRAIIIFWYQLKRKQIAIECTNSNLKVRYRTLTPDYFRNVFIYEIELWKHFAIKGNTYFDNNVTSMLSRQSVKNANCKKASFVLWQPYMSYYHEKSIWVLTIYTDFAFLDFCQKGSKIKIDDLQLLNMKHG